MDAAADRPEFAPPPEPALVRAFALAVVAHLLLFLALAWGVHWKRESQQESVEAELWSALPQEAAPKPEPVPPAPPPPPPQPVVKPAPKPEPPAKNEADIALEREKQKRALEQKRHEEELERQREEREQRAKIEAQKKRDEELARKKELQKQQLAEAKRKEEEKKRKQQEQEAREAKLREQIRQDTLKRNMAMAGTGAPNAAGNAARSSGPSASWGGKVQARVRPNIVFPDNLPGNPEAEVEVRLGPGGMILGSPRLVKSSGHKSWDEAVIRALQKTESLPPDTDGRYPSPVIIGFKPKA